MTLSVTRRSIKLASVILTGLLLGGCGGGGGGGGNNDRGDVPPPTPELSGRLWHTNYALDYLEGAQIASLSGAAPQRVTNDNSAWPWPDGTQYVVADADYENTEVTTHVTASGDVINSTRFPGYVRQVKPSPISKQVILATWSEDTISDTVYFFYDLANKTLLHEFASDDAVTDWLPDGRYLKISSTGEITANAITGEAQSLGTIEIPPGCSIRDVWINRQGTQMVVQMVTMTIDNKIDDSDLWIADINGTNADQLTKTGMSSYANWSPDGLHISFDTDTGFACEGFTCVGSCSLWYVSNTARNVLALESSGDAAHFRVKNRNGSENTLGCELQAWTD